MMQDSQMMAAAALAAIPATYFAAKPLARGMWAAGRMAIGAARSHKPAPQPAAKPQPEHKLAPHDDSEGEYRIDIAKHLPLQGERQTLGCVFITHKTKGKSARRRGHYPLDVLPESSLQIGDASKMLRKRALLIQRPLDEHIGAPQVDLKAADARRKQIRDAAKHGEPRPEPLRLRRSVRVAGVRRNVMSELYLLERASGVPVGKMTGMEAELIAALNASGAALEDADLTLHKTLPGTACMGVEVTSKTRPVIGLRAGLESPEFASSTAELPVVVGIGSDGRPVVDDLSKSPHVLLAGQSGGGKSVQLASILASLHYACTAKQLRIIGIDCKQVELTRWEASPLMMGEVVTTADDAIEPLTRAVEEMEQRNTMLRAAGVTNLKAYNKSARKPLARWLVVVDEMADLLLSNKKQAEKITDMLTRLGQKGRSAGIHLVLCTQRPEVAVIPGIIKANMPDRWAMRVASAIDSRVILDQVGAEKLNGAGDMLRVNSKGSCHVQGLYVDDENTPQLICAALNKRSQQEAA